MMIFESSSKIIFVVNYLEQDDQDIAEEGIQSEEVDNQTGN